MFLVTQSPLRAMKQKCYECIKATYFTVTGQRSPSLILKHLFLKSNKPKILLSNVLNLATATEPCAKC